MDNVTSRNTKIFEQYENLERAGMAPSIAQAIRDFVLATLQDKVNIVDWREYKAERASELEKFETSQDRKSDQICHEIKETQQALENKIDSNIEQVRYEIKENRQALESKINSNIEQVRYEIKETRQALESKINSNIEQVRHEIKETRQKLENKIDSNIEQVRCEIKETRQEFKSDIEKTRNELGEKMNHLRFELVRWMIGLFFAQVAFNIAIVTGIKIFGH